MVCSCYAFRMKCMCNGTFGTNQVHSKFIINDNFTYSAEASSKYLARKGISFHRLHIKGLIVLCWRPLNGLTFRPGCQVRMWILHTKIQDGVQNGRQKDEFSYFSHTGVKDLHKYTYFYVVILRSNLKSIIRL